MAQAVDVVKFSSSGLRWLRVGLQRGVLAGAGALLQVSIQVCQVSSAGDQRSVTRQEQDIQSVTRSQSQESIRAPALGHLVQALLTADTVRHVTGPLRRNWRTGGEYRAGRICGSSRLAVIRTQLGSWVLDPGFL